MRKWIILQSVCAFHIGAYIGFTRVLDLIVWLVSAAGDPMKVILPEGSTFLALRIEGACLFGLLFIAPCIAILIHPGSPAWHRLLLYGGLALAGALLSSAALYELYGFVAKLSEQKDVVIFFSLRSVRWEPIPVIGCIAPIGIAYLLRTKRRHADESKL